MATVLIRFDGGTAPLVMGGIPPDDRTPISDPEPTSFQTNRAFIVAPGVYCFGIDSAIPHTPLWQVVQAIDGQQAVVAFRRIAAP